MCAECENVANYIVKGRKNVHNSKTNKDRTILIPDSDSARQKEATMRVSKKSEAKKFSDFGGGARRYAERKSKNQVDIRDLESQMY